MEYALTDGDPRKKNQCKLCQKTIKGGVYSLKHHLTETQKDVIAYKSVIDEVKKKCSKLLWAFNKD